MARLPADELLKILRGIEEEPFGAGVRMMRVKDLIKLKTPHQRVYDKSLRNTWSRLGKVGKQGSENPAAAGTQFSDTGAVGIGRRIGAEGVVEDGGAQMLFQPPAVRPVADKDLLELRKSVAEEGVLEPVEINNGWVVDGSRRIAMALSTLGPEAQVPVRVSLRHFDPRAMARRGIVPETPEDVRFAAYLSSGSSPISREEAERLVRERGYAAFRQWADENDQFWDEFKQIYGTKGAPATKGYTPKMAGGESLYDEETAFMPKTKRERVRNKERAAQRKRARQPDIEFRKEVAEQDRQIAAERKRRARAMEEPDFGDDEEFADFLRDIEQSLRDEGTI